MNDNLIYSNIKLTIGMLVSNRKEYIRNCMESIKPLLDAVPSELIVVDTKGEETDGSIAIVREYTDKIYPFTWCNDFAAARNVSMKHAQGEWYLYLDDDEWFDDVWEFIDFFTNGECETYRSGVYYTRDYDSDGNYSMSVAGRIVRRRENTCFAGKIHEGFNMMEEPVKIFSCFTHHQGYVYSSDADRAKHQERNLSILREEIKKQGKTLKLSTQLILELISHEKTKKEGLEYCKEYIESVKKTEDQMTSYFQWLLTIPIRFMCNEGMFENAVKEAENVRKNYPVTQMMWQVVTGRFVFCAELQEKYADMVEYAKQYFEMHEWLKEHPTEKTRQMQLDMVNFDTEEYAIQVYCHGAVAANYLEKYEDAFELWCGLPWEEESFDAGEYKQEIVKTLQRKKDKSDFVCFCKRIYKEEFLAGGKQQYLPKECRE